MMDARAVFGESCPAHRSSSESKDADLGAEEREDVEKERLSLGERTGGRESSVRRDLRTLSLRGSSGCVVGLGHWLRLVISVSVFIAVVLAVGRQDPMTECARNCLIAMKFNHKLDVVGNGRDRHL